MNRSRPLAISLALLAAACVLGLDYLRWRRGESAWIFPARPAVAVQAQLEPTLGDIITRQLRDMGLSLELMSQYRDSEGILHMMLEISAEQYPELETRLDRTLEELGADVTKTERTQTEGKVYYLWHILDEDRGVLSLLISCRDLPSPPQEKPPFELLPPISHKVAIIIDDMGNSLEAIEAVCRLNLPITVAVLPYSPLAHETASIARRSNLEVILHLPLESLYNEYDNNHTRGIIHSDMSPEEIIRSVADSLREVPFIDGVNTHMGSRITSDPALIRIVLSQLKGRGLYFIDSRTTADSVAYDVARQIGIPCAYRHVFLDSEIDEGFIRNQLLRLFQLARQNGGAVGIGHPSPETLKVLKETLPLVNRYGLQAVFASEIVR
jgi:polysaccharide deacetylase 2 family uncharacterized protein YibQ